jgi:hypothetical protein
MPPVSYRQIAGVSLERLAALSDGIFARRILAYQALYAIGALLSVFSTYLCIGFIFAVQLNAAIAPRIWRLDRF